MKQSWTNNELVEHLAILPDEYRLLHKKTEKNGLMFITMLKFFQYTGNFFEDLSELPKVIVTYLEKQMKLTMENSNRYHTLDERLTRKYKSMIREFLGFRLVKPQDIELLK